MGNSPNDNFVIDILKLYYYVRFIRKWTIFVSISVDIGFLYRVMNEFHAREWINNDNWFVELHSETEIY